MIEIYATPSEPNRLDGSVQSGHVTRYVPAEKEGRSVVADLGNRHAKEILVGDIDGDGRDELYVSVEASTSGSGAATRIVEPVEIRRYDADTDPKARNVIATLDDRLTRFLTAGDVDGDGKKEMVAAGFKSGLWLLRPGERSEGQVERPADRRGLVGLRARRAADRSRRRRDRRALRRERRPGRGAPLRLEGRPLRERGDPHPQAGRLRVHLEPDAGPGRAGPVASPGTPVPYLSSDGGKSPSERKPGSSAKDRPPSPQSPRENAVAKSLIITEKPSVARDIAAALGGFREEQGYFESDAWVLTWAVGHLFELLEPEEIDAEYKRWTLAEPPDHPGDLQDQAQAGAGRARSHHQEAARARRRRDRRQRLRRGSRGRADLPRDPRALRLHEADPPALAPVDDRGRDPRRLRPTASRRRTREPRPGRPGPRADGLADRDERDAGAHQAPEGSAREGRLVGGPRADADARAAGRTRARSPRAQRQGLLAAGRHLRIRWSELHRHLVRSGDRRERRRRHQGRPHLRGAARATRSSPPPPANRAAPTRRASRPAKRRRRSST